MLTPCPVSRWSAREKTWISLEDIAVVAVLLAPTALCAIGKSSPDPQVKAAELYRQEEWALIQQKDLDLVQVQRI